jgi:formate dehydrogenase (NADP+) alpha subunit
LQIDDGDLVEIASRRDTLAVRALVTDRSPPGVVFLSFHFDEAPTNRLLGSHLDALACTPDYKVTAVRVAPAKMSSASCESPLSGHRPKVGQERGRR